MKKREERKYKKKRKKREKKIKIGTIKQKIENDRKIINDLNDVMKIEKVNSRKMRKHVIMNGENVHII